MRAIAVALGLPEDHFDEPFRDAPAWMGKLVHYVGGVVEAAGDQGVGSHADYGFVTLLLQDEVGGLEVLPPGASAWAPVEPTPEALVVNLGEMLEVATEGYLAATIHRVKAPPPGVDRYSVPFFWSPRLDAVIDPVPLPAELKAQARGISDDPSNPMLASFGLNMLKGRMRAHPDVTERHYPELLNADFAAAEQRGAWSQAPQTGQRLYFHACWRGRVHHDIQSGGLRAFDGGLVERPQLQPHGLGAGGDGLVNRRPRPSANYEAVHDVDGMLFRRNLGEGPVPRSPRARRPPAGSPGMISIPSGHG